MPIVLVVIVLTLALSSIVAHTVSGLHQKNKIRSATDMAALAGANRLHNGAGDPCELALTTFARNDTDARDVTCAVVGETVVVTAEYRLFATNTPVISRAGPGDSN